MCASKRPTPVFEAVDMGKSFGIEVIYLPVSHPELNPIELMWARVKGSIRRNNCDFTMRSLESLGDAAIGEITAADWVKAETHCTQIENKYYALYEDEQNHDDISHAPEFDEDVNYDT